MAAQPIIESIDERFNPIERAAWLGFLRSHSALLRRLDADLRKAHGISISAYEALIVLGRSETGSLQMSDLADRTLLTQSGISRLVTRLERDGLVARQTNPADRRASLVALTPEGERRLRDGAATHFGGVRARFLNRFTTEELERLAEHWDRLALDSRDGALGDEDEPQA